MPFRTRHDLLRRGYRAEGPGGLLEGVVGQKNLADQNVFWSKKFAHVIYRLGSGQFLIESRAPVSSWVLMIVFEDFSVVGYSRYIQ